MATALARAYRWGAHHWLVRTENDAIELKIPLVYEPTTVPSRCPILVVRLAGGVQASASFVVADAHPRVVRTVVIIDHILQAHADDRLPDACSSNRRAAVGASVGAS